MHILVLWQHPEQVVPDLLCLLVCLAATLTDLRSRRIPNWLTFPAIGAGLLVNTLIPTMTHGFGVGIRIGLLSSVVGAMLLLLCFGLLGAIRFVGMGDVKLMVAVGAFLRWPTALWALAYVALVGGVIGLVYALARGRLGRVLRNIGAVSRRAVQRADSSGRQDPIELHRIPYALAILIGATWAAAVKYWPWLSLG